MKVKSRNHVYECVPPFLDNRKVLEKDKETEQIIIGLKVATLPEQDDYRRELAQISADYAVDKAAELQKEKTLEFIASKFSFVKNLEIEGFEGKELDFQTFYKEAPPELVNWCIRSVMNTTALTEAERKNW